MEYLHHIAAFLHADKTAVHELALALLGDIFAQFVIVQEVPKVFSGLIAILMLGDVFTHIGRRLCTLYEDKVIQVVCQLFYVLTGNHFRIIRNT